MMLASRVVLVSGGSGAIGGAVALACAHAGADVGLTWRGHRDQAEETAQKIRDAGRRAAIYRADSADSGSCGEAVEQCSRDLGDIDGLVTAQGGAEDALLATTSDERWQRVIGANLAATMAFCRASAKRMARRRRGAIVNISSFAPTVPAPGQSAYAAAKGGIDALTRALAVELGPRGVRVNALAPGRIATPMTAAVHAREKDALMGRIPLRRYGTPEEVARAAVFLLSDHASYITGQIIVLDGGLSLAAKIP